MRLDPDGFCSGGAEGNDRELPGGRVARGPWSAVRAVSFPQLVSFVEQFAD
jgi:hypothetical protein